MRHLCERLAPHAPEPCLGVVCVPETKKPQTIRSGASQNVERDKRLELSTYTLARYRSTN
jgi:hypothetical protein